MKARLLQPMPVKDPATDQYIERPIGFEIEGPLVYILCDQTIAEPADDECRRAAKKRTPEQFAAARLAQRAVELGIAPEDLELFRAGIIAGYRPDFAPDRDPPAAQYLPGPNWTADHEARLNGDDDETADDAE